MGKNEKQASAMSTAPASLGFPRAKVTAGQGLNLRAGPGTGFKAHIILAKDTEVQLLELWASGPQGQFDVRVEGWRYVFTGTMAGWADARFLAPAEPGDV